MPKNTPVHNYLAKLGLEAEIADLYLALHNHGPQHITGLARLAGVERTRVYRLLDKLTAANLIETETHNKRIILRAAPITNLQILLAEREQEVRNLQDELMEIHRNMNDFKTRPHFTRVQFYRGAEGNKQMFWNQTKAKGESLSILFETMQTRTSRIFFERWVRVCNEKDLQFRGIVGDHFLQDLQNWYGKNDNERLENWESRYISPDIYPINHSTVIYDNVTAHYNWKDGEVFGIEIYNQEIADAQRRVFEIIWQQCVPITNDLLWKPWKSNETT
jgi:DNA-binding MarR family transcriptional regulator